MENVMTRRIVRFVSMALLAPTLASAQGTGRPGTTAKAPVAAPVHLVLAPAGNEARFIVRELLMANTIENDAIGATSAISGTIVLDAQGTVDPAASKFTVLLDSLKSDKGMRDRYIKGRTIVTSHFPTAVLVVKELQGLPATLPTSGTMTFTLIGDLTIHGVTRPSTWMVNATADPTGFSGMASTHLKFEDFDMNQPSVPVLAHLTDDITLEYDFHLVKADK
jgi:polyisoprenoid-binding protein YceI